MSKYNVVRACFIPAILLALFLGYFLIAAALSIVLLALLSLGAFAIQWNFYYPSINSIPKSENLFLTFDDGPDPIYTPQILDLLKSYNSPATFFVIGKKIKGNEDLLCRMVAEGHTVGGHSWSHSYWFDLFPTKRMKEEILLTQNTIEAITGSSVSLFRPPYGVTNPMLARAMRQSNVQSIGWSVRSLDTVILSPTKLWDRIKNRLKTGEIVLLHDTQRQSVVVLGKILANCRERNLTIGNLQEQIKF